MKKSTASRKTSTLDLQVAAAEKWFKSPRFKGIVRLYSPRQVAEQQGTIDNDYTVARDAAEGFYARLRELFDRHKSITTFGPYSPGQAVVMKRLGIEGIYLGGWATSAKGSITEDPGADLASYPLSQVPDEAAPIVRALLMADRNQHFQRARMTRGQLRSHPEIDFRPFIIADADTGHGGDAHVRNLIRRFVEVGVPGYHIEDQKPGAKKCGHQGGKVLVSQDEQIKRLNAARFQLDIMRVPGIIVARTDAEAATFIESTADERDHPFILGATNVDMPRYKVGYLAIMRRLNELGVSAIRGHLLFSIPDDEFNEAFAWLEKNGILEMCKKGASKYDGSSSGDDILDPIASEYLERWQAEAGLKTYAQAVADAMEFGMSEGEKYEMTVKQWLAFAERASFQAIHARATELKVRTIWDCDHPKTPEGYYQLEHGIEYAISRSLAAAPFADIIWMETKTANLGDAHHFAKAIRALFPDKMLAYNLSPSFNWDTTGMTDDEMKRFPTELGKLGYVFNFITYGGHQVDGLAGEEFATALKQDGMLALARLQRKLRLIESPYRTPQTLVGGPRLDSALMASSGRTATTKAMGGGSTQFQHLVQTEVPRKVLVGWLEMWRAHYRLPGTVRVELRPHTAGSDLLELKLINDKGRTVANIIFANMQDRRGTSFLSVRNQNTFVESYRKKRLMTLVHLFLIHRYKATSVHYVSPTDDVLYQTRRMKHHGIFAEVHSEIGEMIVASVNAPRIAELLEPDHVALKKLINKTGPPSSGR